MATVSGGGNGGTAGIPAPVDCPHITTTAGVLNACGRTLGTAVSPDGALLATGTETPRPNVHLWRLSDGAFVRHLDGVGDTTLSVAFSPDGKLLAAAGGYLNQGALSGLPEIVKIWNVADGSLVATIPATCGYYASTAVFSHDGTLLVTAGVSGPAEVWRVSDGSLVTSISSANAIDSASFSPTDREVLLGGFDGRATLWSLATGALMMTLDATAKPRTDAAFSPDGGEVATTGINNNLALWNTATGALRQTMVGHEAAVRHVIWVGPDRLVSNDVSGTVKSWTRVGSGDFALSGGWTTGAESLGMAVSADKTRLVAGGADPLQQPRVEGFVFLLL